MRTFIAVLVAFVLFTTLAFAEVYSNMVGLYKINCGVGRNLVSMPFLPFNSTLDNVIGNQLTGHTFNKAQSDTIERWDPVAKNYQRAWYNTTQAKWLDWTTGGTPFNFNPDESYWINILNAHPAKTVTLLGEVSEVNRTIAIGVGRNLVAPSFPKEITLANSGLIASGFTGHSFNKAQSDRIEWWDRSTGYYFSVWYKTADSTWRNFGDGAVATKSIVPGEGFWVIVLAGHSGFNWVIPKPY